MRQLLPYLGSQKQVHQVDQTWLPRCKVALLGAVPCICCAPPAEKREKLVQSHRIPVTTRGTHTHTRAHVPPKPCQTAMAADVYIYIYKYLYNFAGCLQHTFVYSTKVSVFRTKTINRSDRTRGGLGPETSRVNTPTAYQTNYRWSVCKVEAVDSFTL